VTSPRLTLALHWLIALNLFVATILLIGGDTKNAMLGMIGAGCFILALLVQEFGDA
jgi:hypothetical protein